MPPKESTKSKKWGQADKDLKADLIFNQLIDITDTTLNSIGQVRQAHFGHPKPDNFRRNFRDYLAHWDLEVGYGGARRNKGM